MRITRIEIENFRSIRHLVVDLGETTVFVGPNNAGKTAILDALRIALTRRWGQRGTGFSEYDIHLADDSADPKTSEGVRIELRSEESEPGEWPDTITEDLGDIIQVDLHTGHRSITLQTRFAWNEDTEAFEPSWEFLDASREPLAGSSARRTNLDRFWRYLPVFYLDALRDAGDEFSPRSSQFWTQLLKALQVPADIESEALQMLDLLNQRLLKADPRLGDIAETISGATRIASRDREGDYILGCPSRDAMSLTLAERQGGGPGDRVSATGCGLANPTQQPHGRAVRQPGQRCYSSPSPSSTLATFPN